MIDLNDLVWQFAIIQLTHTLPNLHFMAVSQCPGPLLQASVPWDLSWLLLLMSLVTHTLPAHSLFSCPKSSYRTRQETVGESENQGEMAFWGVGQGHAIIVKEEQEYPRNWEVTLLVFSSASLGTWVKQPTDTHGIYSDWEQVPCRLHPNWVEHVSGLLWGFSRAEFWGEPHPSGMFCLAGPPTWVALSPGWVARATQPGCGDGQSLQVSKSAKPWFQTFLVIDLISTFKNIPEASSEQCIRDRVSFFPSFYIIHV